jgi:uncharacterized protein (TIRG00374 family)
MDKLIKILKNLLFLSFGLFLFWWIFKDIKLEELKTELHRVNWFWIAVSVILSLLSHLSRAIRWKMLVKPLGYNMNLRNTYLAVLVMYFVNLLIPRAGEVARCSVLTKYEKVPFTSLVGTVIIERIADTITLLLLAIVIFAINFDMFSLFITQHPEMSSNFFAILSTKNIIIGLIFIAISIASLLIFKPFTNSKIGRKINEFTKEFKNGVFTILNLENKWKFIFHTLLIFTLWLLMFSAVFLAYPPTNGLNLNNGMFIFMMSGFAMLLPVQGGIGPWHFVVIETLYLYGIDKYHGKVFALIGHTSTNLIYLIVGFIAFMILPYLNKTKN